MSYTVGTLLLLPFHTILAPIVGLALPIEQPTSFDPGLLID
jgi:hypothetical protein